MVEAEAKRVQFCSKDWDAEQGLNFFKFGDGTTLEVDVKKLNDEIRADLLHHGISQKVGDSYASAKGNFVEGIANAKAVIEGLYAGIWSPGRDGEGRPRLGELAEAIARIKAVDLEKATKAVEAATDEERTTWRSNLKVKSTIATIRAEKAAKALEANAEQELNIKLDA